MSAITTKTDYRTEFRHRIDEGLRTKALEIAVSLSDGRGIDSILADSEKIYKHITALDQFDKEHCKVEYILEQVLSHIQLTSCQTR